jgi:hypothetical protein
MIGVAFFGISWLKHSSSALHIVSDIRYSGTLSVGFTTSMFLLLINRSIAFGRTKVAQHSAPSGSYPTITSHEFYRQTLDRLRTLIDVSVISTRNPGTPLYYLSRE